LQKIKNLFLIELFLIKKCVLDLRMKRMELKLLHVRIWSFTSKVNFLVLQVKLKSENRLIKSFFNFRAYKVDKDHSALKSFLNTTLLFFFELYHSLLLIVHMTNFVIFGYTIYYLALKSLMWACVGEFIAHIF